MLPIAEKEAKSTIPIGNPSSRYKQDSISDTQRLARETNIDLLFGKCHLYRSLVNTAERLRRTSHLSAPLAIAEGKRIYNPKLTNY